MMNKDTKELLKERFDLLFPSNSLLGIKLDGFSHSVAFVTEKEKRIDILTYSAYAPEMNFDKRVATLFSGISHGQYQNNHQIFYWEENEDANQYQ